MQKAGYVFLVLLGTVFSQEIVCPSDGEISNVCMNPCQPTCAQPTPPLSSPFCEINVCEEGCMCEPHLLRDTESGLCIPPSDCPEVSVPTCKGENEEFNTCASLCPNTCLKSCSPPNGCIAGCDERCDCKFGFIRDDNSSKCITPAKCPKCKCGANEIWARCQVFCEETCYSLKHPQNCFSPAVCLPGCNCDRGYVRNERTGLCVRKNQCPP